MRRAQTRRQASGRASKRAAPPTAPADTAAARGGGRRIDATLLLTIYVIVVAAHIVFFWGVSEFPYLCTDAVQYVTTAENLVRGNGFTIRGSFNSSCPPLYPLFLALAFWLGPEPRTTAFILSCLVISAIVVPAYLLARRLELNRPASSALALTAGVLPHTLYCSFNMTEPLYLPLFVWAGYYAYRWFVRPSRRISVILGVAVSIMLLTKIAALVVVAAFAIAAPARAAAAWRSDRKEGRATALNAAIVLAIVAVTQGAWVALKAVHQASALGTYGTVLHDQGLPFLSAKLVTTYVADYFLAPGLLTAVPLLYFFVRRWQSEKWAAVYFILLFSNQLGWVAVVDGGLTGMLRERLLSFSFPIIAILATKGFVELNAYRSRVWLALFVLAPPALAGLLGQYDFHEPSAVEYPWAYAFGAISGRHLVPFLATRMVITTITMSVVAGAGLWLAARRAGGSVFSVVPLGFQLVPFCVVAFLLGRATPASLAIIGPVKNWFASNGAGMEARLLIASAPAIYEMRPLDLSRRGLFPECRPGSAIDPIPIWQMETYYRWDVRSVCDPDEVKAQGRAGDLLLTAHEIKGSQFLSQMGAYRLYRLTTAPVVSAAPTDRLLGYIDYPKRGAIIKNHSVVGGWAIAGESTITEVSIFLDGIGVGQAATQGRRPDVKAAFPTEPQALFSGFYTIFDFSRFAAGEHTLTIKVRTADGRTLALGREVPITILR